MYKKRLALALMLMILLNLITVDVVKAAEQIVVGDKSNYNFINTYDYNNIQYTYEKKGETYYVYECMNEDSSEVYTKIYVVKGEEEILLEEFTTYIQSYDGYVCLSKYEDGTLVDRRNIDTVDENNNIVVCAGRPYDGLIYYDASTGRYFTGWYYDYSHTGSNFFEDLTYTVIIAALAATFGYSYPVATAIFAAVAQKIVDENITRVYWTKEVYHVNQISYPARELYGSFIGQKIYITFYSDSARTNVIGSDIQEWYDEEEWPSRITIGPA